MGIYIRDMKMPTNCDDCLLGSDCPHDQSIDGYKMQGGRPCACPLIPAVDVWPKWISVDERLPKEMEMVLVTDGKTVGWSFCVNDYGTMEFYTPWKITHWMPPPPPPKEET